LQLIRDAAELAFYVFGAYTGFETIDTTLRVDDSLSQRRTFTQCAAHSDKILLDVSNDDRLPHCQVKNGAAPVSLPL
jgi:hypothetical protein